MRKSTGTIMAELIEELLTDGSTVWTLRLHQGYQHIDLPLMATTIMDAIHQYNAIKGLIINYSGEALPLNIRELVRK